MTLVVADAGPLRYLAVVEALDVLPILFGRVIVPPAVLAELTHESAPFDVQTWASHLPSWVEVYPGPITLASHLREALDPGEAAAIALAQMVDADLVLLDETEGRRIAVECGLAVAGTVGVLERAANEGLLELPVVFKKLRATNFRVHERILTEALARNEKRKRSQ